MINTINTLIHSVNKIQSLCMLNGWHIKQLPCFEGIYKLKLNYIMICHQRKSSELLVTSKGMYNAEYKIFEVPESTLEYIVEYIVARMWIDNWIYWITSLLHIYNPGSYNYN
jgi:hypothetical protein